MESIREHIDNLIIKYSKKTITPAEEEELYNWIIMDPGNRLYFKSLLTAIRAINEPATSFDAQRSLIKFQNQTRINKSSILVKWLSIAASIILLIGVGWWWFIKHSTSSESIKYFADQNELLVCVLSDNTNVTLSKNSVLLSPKEFDNYSRRVILKGKAYFDVEKNVGKPFEVIAGNIIVKVLGTSFEIDMDTLANELCISVVEGKVSVIYPPENIDRLLYKSQQICLTQNGKILNEKSLANENYLSWKTGVLVFNNTPMSEVAMELEKLYDKPVLFKHSHIKEYFINTKIIGQNFDQINTIFEVALNVSLVDKGDTIIIMEKDQVK